ncbi:MAG: hypothetical protein WC529_07405 [Candidatus Margulisiibacteriota bacterium]
MINNAYRRISPEPLSTLSPVTPQKGISVSSSFIESFKSVIQGKATEELTAVKPLKTAGTLIDYSLKKEVKLSVPRLLQGHNACGPTSLNMALGYYGVSGVKFDSCTVGSSPNRLIEAADKKGMTVRQENNGSLADLTALLDMGIPPVVLGINGGKKGSEIFTPGNFIANAQRAHWMTVSGYKTDERGEVTHLYVNNPATGSTQTCSKADFLKFWDDNIVPGGHRYYMAMAPKSNPTYSFQLAALKRYLPQDKISGTFKDTLAAVHKLEEAFYEAEKVADKAKDFLDKLFG